MNLDSPAGDRMALKDFVRNSEQALKGNRVAGAWIRVGEMCDRLHRNLSNGRGKRGRIGWHAAFSKDNREQYGIAMSRRQAESLIAIFKAFGEMGSTAAYLPASQRTLVHLATKFTNNERAQLLPKLGVHATTADVNRVARELGIITKSTSKTWTKADRIQRMKADMLRHGITLEDLR